MIARLHHVQLAMPAGGEQKARLFYSDLLGIAEREKPEELKNRGGCWFENSSLRVHLGVEENFKPARKAHPGFQTADFESLRSKLLRAGHENTGGAQIDGCARFFVEDPFGNRIEIIATD